MANWFIGPQEKPNQKQLAAKNATIAIFFREYICLKSNLNKSVYRNKNQRNECYRIKYDQVTNYLENMIFFSEKIIVGPLWRYHSATFGSDGLDPIY